ncbi:MAG: alpha/beta hydrolase [Myxococcota bacterium]|nr:alpha/beta hydrolase [Myxococcota bacterium]MEC8425394.1 alpha/beta hydrolase [Myxococcota bacterium]
MTVSTEVYGKGQRHIAWNGPVDDIVDLLLDVYEPVDAPPGRPAVVVIHGGGFTGGSRTNENSVEFARYFAERGFVSVSIDYRVTSDRATLPQAWMDVVAASDASQSQRLQALGMYGAARDAKAAVRWLVANADRYQLDTDHITAIGGSAGSYLATMLGVTNPEDFRDDVSVADDPTLETTNLSSSADVHTIIDHWGGITHMEILKRINGKSRFDRYDAPVSIVHGTEDETVPFTEAEKLRDAYETTGAPFAMHPLEGRGHGPWDATVDGRNLRELAFGFVVDQQSLNVVR